MKRCSPRGIPPLQVQLTFLYYNVYKDLLRKGRKIIVYLNEEKEKIIQCQTETETKTGGFCGRNPILYTMDSNMVNQGDRVGLDDACLRWQGKNINGNLFQPDKMFKE
mgnify:CR=1 FL=1